MSYDLNIYIKIGKIMSFNNVLDNYIDSNDELALQINGGWGIGKTYALNQYIREKENYQANKEKTEYKFIYVSANGAKGVNELASNISGQIFAEIFKIKPAIRDILFTFNNSSTTDFTFQIQSRIIKLSTSLGIVSWLFRLFKKSYSTITNGKIKNKKIVFVIDDLERVVDESVVREIFGYVSVKLQAEFGAKVILIGNESKMNGDILNELREKVIGKKYEFKANESAQVRDIINDFFEQANLEDKKIADNLVSLSDSFNLAQNKLNLRTLKSIISNTEYVIKKIFSKEHKINDLEIKQKNLIEWIFISTYLVVENKKIVFGEELNEMFPYIEATFSKFSMYYDVQNIVMSYVKTGELNLEKLSYLYLNNDEVYIDKNILEMYDYVFGSEGDLKKRQEELWTKFPALVSSHRTEVSNVIEAIRYFDSKSIWFVEKFSWDNLVKLIINNFNSKQFRSYELSQQGKLLFSYLKVNYVNEYQILKNASEKNLKDIKDDIVRNIVDELYKNIEAYMQVEINDERREKIFEILLSDLQGEKSDFSNTELYFLQSNINELERFRFKIPIDFWNQKSVEFMDAINDLRSNDDIDRIGKSILNDLTDSLNKIIP